MTGTVINSIAIGLIISSAFSAMVVYAQELTPGNVGAVAGLFFGLSFGLGGVGAALLGMLADKTSLTFVYQVCAFLPAVGLLGGFLPRRRARRSWQGPRPLLTGSAFARAKRLRDFSVFANSSGGARSGAKPATGRSGSAWI